jgi:hypothetical protein
MSYSYSRTESVIAHAAHTWEEWHAYLSDTSDAPEWAQGNARGLCCHSCQLVIVDVDADGNAIPREDSTPDSDATPDTHEHIPTDGVGTNASVWCVTCDAPAAQCTQRSDDDERTIYAHELRTGMRVQDNSTPHAVVLSWDITRTGTPRVIVDWQLADGTFERGTEYALTDRFTLVPDDDDSDDDSTRCRACIAHPGWRHADELRRTSADYCAACAGSGTAGAGQRELSQRAEAVSGECWECGRDYATSVQLVGHIIRAHGREPFTSDDEREDERAEWMSAAIEDEREREDSTPDASGSGAIRAALARRDERERDDSAADVLTTDTTRTADTLTSGEVIADTQRYGMVRITAVKVTAGNGRVVHGRRMSDGTSYVDSFRAADRITVYTLRDDSAATSDDTSCPVVYPFGIDAEALCPACGSGVAYHVGAERDELRNALSGIVSAATRDDGNAPAIGQRVSVPAYTDSYMRGYRYGNVTSVYREHARIRATDAYGSNARTIRLPLSEYGDTWGAVD